MLRSCGKCTQGGAAYRNCSSISRCWIILTPLYALPSPLPNPCTVRSANNYALSMKPTQARHRSSERGSSSRTPASSQTYRLTPTCRGFSWERSSCSACASGRGGMTFIHPPITYYRTSTSDGTLPSSGKQSTGAVLAMSTSIVFSGRV